MIRAGLCWLPLDITVEVEAKSKELAVLDFMKKLNRYIIRKPCKFLIKKGRLPG
jgi:hypothetical protein